MKESDQHIRLECLKITAEARAKAGLYDPDQILADAKGFHDWIAETIPDPRSPSSKPKKPKTG